MSLKPTPSGLVDADLELIDRQGLKGFVKVAWPQLMKGIPFINNWHIDEICLHLEALYCGEINNLIINVPPGTMKTLLCSVNFPLWVWATQDPGYRILSASFDATLMTRCGSQIRDLVGSAWWKARWPSCQLKDGQQGISDFETSGGGFHLATTPRGKGTGRHVHLVKVDDPHKPLDIARGGDLSTDAQNVWEWWTGTVPSRAADPSRFRKLVIMQRLAEYDLTGRILEAMETGGQHFEHLKLPMDFNPSRKSVTSIGGDRRTKDNELLWPARFPRETVEEIKLAMRAIGGDQNVAAQFDQEPTAKTGNQFKVEWIQHWGPGTKYPRVPEGVGVRFGVSGDCTFKGAKESKGKVDFVVFQLWCYFNGDALLIDQIRGQWSFSETIIQVRKWLKSWEHRGANYWVKKIEDKANGPAVANVLSAEIPGVELVTPEGGKEARASAVEPVWRSMSVWLPPLDVVDQDGELWVPGFIREILVFPKGKNDDQVDAMTQELLEMAQGQSSDLLAKFLRSYQT